MNIELIKERIKNCLMPYHEAANVEVNDEKNIFFIEVDTISIFELKKIAAEFEDDNIIILPGYNYKTVRIGIKYLDKQLRKELNHE